MLSAGDHVRVIKYHIERLDWQSALVCLSQQDDPELVYRYSPQLLKHEPVLAVDAWMQMKLLDPRRLIPALMRYSLSWCVGAHCTGALLGITSI